MAQVFESAYGEPSGGYKAKPNIIDQCARPFILIQIVNALSVSVSVCYVAVRTIVLSRYGRYRARLWIFWGFAGWKLRLRPLRFFYVQL